MPNCKPIECFSNGGCTLAPISTGFLKPEGDCVNGVLILGEAAGEAEARESLPFRPYAAAGSILERCINKAGFRREEFALFNVVNCRPPKNLLEGQKYEAGAVNHCKVHVQKVIDRYKPRVILAAGGVACKWLTGMVGPKKSISLLRGFVYDTTYGIPCIPTLHPAFIARGQAKYLPVLIRDIQFSVQVAKNGIKADRKDYLEHPTVNDVRDYLNFLRANPRLPISYDIETDYSLRQPDEADVRNVGRNIEQIQFSHEPHQAIVLPWVGEYIELARQILALPNDKWGWNSISFDQPILEEHNVKINGRHHDLMLAWHHLQPDLPKGLQFVTSFYAPEVGAWKHLSDAQPQLYGGIDVDAVSRIGQRVFEDLDKTGIGRGYWKHIFQLQPVLKRMCDRGFPVDRPARDAFRAKIAETSDELLREIEGRIPDSIRKIHPPNGFKVAPKGVKEIAKLLEIKMGKGRENHFPESFKRTIKANFGLDCKQFPDGYERFFRSLPFQPSSDEQIKSYIRAKGHKMPTKLKERDDAGRPKETTEKRGLERLYKQTGDNFYLKVIEYRELGKVASTYIDGWKLDEEGRVHSEFTFGPATGQLSSRSPNIQNVLRTGDLADEFRKIIRPASGKALVAFDYCVAPETRILTDDLRWVSANDLNVNDSVIAFDEYGRRRLHRSKVLSKKHLVRPRIKITTDKGELICSTEHKWLARFSYKAHYDWKEAKDLLIGNQIAYFVRPWKVGTDYDSGWMNGILDGEGCVDADTGCSVALAQNDGLVFDKIKAVLNDKGYRVSWTRGTSGKCNIGNIVGEAFVGLRALGEFQPVRLKQKFLSHLDGMSPWSSRKGSTAATVLNIESIEEGEVIALETEHRTFIAEGFFSHNCSFHVLTLGFESKDADYMRMARHDIHSYLAGHLLKLGDRDTWLQLSSQDLERRMAEIKRDHKFVRNKKAKPGILGYGLGLGAQKLYDMNLESFDNKKEAQNVINMLNTLFPAVARFREEVKALASQQGFLRSRHGYIRRFNDIYHHRQVSDSYEPAFGEILKIGRNGHKYKRVTGEEGEAAIAQLVQNDAHGHIKDVMLDLAERELDERYGLINTIHDELLFECPEGLLDSCLEDVSKAMERPSTILVDPEVAPNGLACGITASIGNESWQSMVEIYKTDIKKLLAV